MKVLSNLSKSYIRNKFKSDIFTSTFNMNLISNFKFSFRNINLVNTHKCKQNIFFIDVKDLESKDTYLTELLKKNSNISNNLKNTGSVMLYETVSKENNYPGFTYLVKYDSTKKSEISKTISGIISQLMTKQTNELQVIFSNSINSNNQSFILSNIVSSNYIPNQNDKSYILRETFKSQEKLNTIENLKIFNQYEEINVNKLNDLKKGVFLGLSKTYSQQLANTRSNIADCDYFEKECEKIINEFNEQKRLNSNKSGKVNSLSNNVSINEINLIDCDISKSNLSESNNLSASMKVIRGKELEKERMNLFYQVGKSANSEPRLILLQYNGDTTSDQISHCIVGKGLTFDTGGINLKPTGYLEDMFLDKQGACNALSIFKQILELKLNMNVMIALVMAENSIDGKSYKPSDIIVSRKGLTVEIGNTDAEGRLCLADSFTYIQDNYKPKNIIDMATLTGACMVALGNETAGFFTNDKTLGKDLYNSSL